MLIVKINYFFIRDLVCFINKLIKSTNKNNSCDDSDSSSFSTELSDTEADDVLNLDGCDEKLEETE